MKIVKQLEKIYSTWAASDKFTGIKWNSIFSLFARKIKDIFKFFFQTFYSNRILIILILFYFKLIKTWNLFQIMCILKMI